jgi:hypothetical protein
MITECEKFSCLLQSRSVTAVLSAACVDAVCIYSQVCRNNKDEEYWIM